MNKQLTKEQVLMKSEGVNDCIKWLKSKIDNKNKEIHDNNYLLFYDEYNMELKGQLDTLVDIKVSLEKYKKKLKHIADEM